MASQTLQRMEQALAQVVARPTTEVVAELQKVAAGDPGNPAPHLAMAMVTGFARQTFDESRRHLEEAGKLLDKGRPAAGDAEWEFSQSLYQSLRSELTIAEARQRQTPRTAVAEADRETVVRATLEGRQALQAMEALLPRIKDSGLLKLIQAALLTHSFTSRPGSGEYRRGMTTLGAAFRGKQRLADLGGMFLMYGYRKARNYKQAIDVGKKLADRNPRSAMPRVMLGSVHFFAHDYAQAEASYKQAVALAPNAPQAHLGYAKVLERTGKVDQARQSLQKARTLDKAGSLKPFLDETEVSAKLRERFGPQFRGLGGR